MAWNVIQCAFLLAFLARTALAQVPTPTNVTLECHNVHNVLRWDYNQLTSGLKFKVRVASESSEPVERWVNSPPLQIDLSDFSDPDDSYFVSVFAVMGGNVSTASDGISYSYSTTSTDVDQKCTVDVPTVNVTILEDHVIHFRFMHPWLLYNTDPKPKKKRSHELPVFVYSVKVINQSKDSHPFRCTKKVCEEKTIPVDSSQEKYCVHVEGTIKKISVLPTQEYCSASPEKAPETSQVYIIIGVLVFILIVIIIAVMICMKKIKPPTSITVPEILKFNGPKEEHLVPIRDQDETCEVHVEPVPSTHLMTSTDINDSTLGDAPSIESEGRLPIRAQTKDSNVDDEAEAIQEDVEESGYKKGNDLDEDSSQNLDFSADTGYEKRNLDEDSSQNLGFSGDTGYEHRPALE